MADLLCRRDLPRLPRFSSRAFFRRSRRVSQLLLCVTVIFAATILVLGGHYRWEGEAKASLPHYVICMGATLASVSLVKCELASDIM